MTRAEVAQERYDRLHAEGKSTGWAGYCIVPDSCTSPCIECGRIGRNVDALFRNTEASRERALGAEENR